MRQSTQDAHDGQDECEQVVVLAGFERGGRPDAEHAVGTSGHVLPLKHDSPDNLRERERQHGEIDAGEADSKPAE